MFRRISPSYRVPLAIAVFLHLILLLVVMLQIPLSHRYRSDQTHVQTKPIVQAVTVDQQAVAQQIKQIKHQQQQRRLAQQARIEKLKQQALALQRQKQAEQKRLARLKAKRLKWQLAERQRLLAKQKHQQQLLKAQQVLQEKLLQQQLSSEQKQLARSRARQLEGVIDQYRAQIVQAIEQQWIVPSEADQHLSCVFAVHLAPGGVVLDVKLLRGSGNPLLDRSARIAVFKASPLPVPKDPAVFSAFRELHLTVRPLSKS